MMRIALSTLLGILFFSITLMGQTADDYYHQGAQLFIGDEIDPAIEAVQKGLQIDPASPRLQALWEKLQRKKEQQQQQQQQEQQQQQQEQSEQQQSSQEQEAQNQEEQQQEAEEQQAREQQQEEPPQPREAGEPEEQKELSEEDAERILQALLSKEKENQKLRRAPTAGKKRVEKDW